MIDEAIDESVHTEPSASASGAMLKLDLSKKDETKEEEKATITPRTGKYVSRAFTINCHKFLYFRNVLGIIFGVVSVILTVMLVIMQFCFMGKWNVKTFNDNFPG